MPAYNFQKRFARLVEQGLKPNTIRARRKRPTVVGDTLYLYTGMRSKNCRRLRVEKCTNVLPITVHARGIRLGRIALSFSECTVLARRDGFVDFTDMRVWFKQTHGLPTRGLELICWEPARPSRDQKRKKP